MTSTLQAPVHDRSLQRLWTLFLLLTLLSAFSLKVMAQTGNVCQTPMEITSLPYNDAGNTSAYGDDYDNADVPPVAPGAVTTGTGSNYYITGDDVVYSYTPAYNGAISISTTNDDDWVGLWVFTGCPFASTVGYHTATSGATRAINGLPVQQGVTYYIVISSWPDPQSIGYTLHVELDWAAEPCTETPVPGATTGPSDICPGVAFTLSLENTTNNNGITYQWESSPDGLAWSDAPGNSTTASYTTTQTADTWYRCQVTCDAAGTGTSTPLLVTTNDPMQCYCIPTGAANNSDEILNFTLANLNHSSGPSEGTNGYSNYAGSVAAAQLVIGTSYTASLTSGIGTGNHGAAIWIDYNDNGLFEATEMVTFIGNTIQPGSTANFPAFTAANAPGVHRLRVQYRYNQSGDVLDPCVASTFSETEDYLVEVAPAGPVTDCLGVVDGPALPGTPCTGTNGYGGLWNDNCICVENVGVAEVEASIGLRLYPNPASTVLYIATANGLPVHVKVYDMLGQLMLEKDHATEIEVGHLGAGSYSLHLVDGHNTVKARARFLKL